MTSGADEAGVEGAGDGDVGGALDDGAAVGEEGEGVGAAAEAEEEVVGAEVLNVGVGAEAGAHGGEVDGAVMLVDLDGVAAAESDVGAVLAGEMGEVALAADLAAGAGRGRRRSRSGRVPAPAGFQRSKESRVRRMRCGWPVRNLSASVTWMEAARLTAVERMPAVSQVSTLPVGGLGKMQARQAVAGTGPRFEARGSRVGAAWGRMFMVAA